MKANNNTPTRQQVRRSEAARLLGIHPRTVARYEARGLTAVRRNSRMTFYYLDEVLNLQQRGLPTAA
jgi:DNA-binding transcriptional MerR regulator